MQRRAAAVYVALFLVIAVGAFAYAGAAQSPPITVDNPDYNLTADEELQINGTTYTVASIGEVEPSGGGHGGGGSAHLEATVEWNTSAEASEEWLTGPDNAVTYQDSDYEVVIENATNVSQFTLREVPGDNVTVYTDGDGDRVVEVERGGQTDIVPIDQYQGLQRYDFSEGDAIQYDGQNATVGNVTNGSATITWTAQETQDVALAEGDTTERLGDQMLVAHFPDSDHLVLSSNVAAYNDQADQQAFFHDRTDGLLMISFLSGATGFILLATAYLPRRE
ncbi:hypothetical protein SAMN06269185_1510 [Natronoarchaeum philippinense]|uniref:Uncharacterized protein n=1 Tax=Natronoarchaeum philippinense TaxID=558529 RepID=A0A285NRP7_NATPI|nr:hypothetical protein [Natronoarchaeum philippinense]SNZ12129.1 hypothetical protein SAMN06269185_1510 [Natronoarchaeum philippinense]